MSGKRKVLLAGAAILAVGSSLVGVHSAQAAPEVFDAGSGSHVTCDFTSKSAFLDSGMNKVALKNNYDHTAHTSDPGYDAKTATTGHTTISNAVAALPDNNTFAPLAPITTSTKGKAFNCTGNVVNPATGHSFAVTGATITGSQVGSTPSGQPATCAGLASGLTGFFNGTISWKATGAKPNPSVIQAQLGTLVDAHGFGYTLDTGTSFPGTTLTGSFSGAGSTSHSDAYLDAKSVGPLIAGVTGPTVDSQNGTTKDKTMNIKALNPCEPTMKIKATGLNKDGSLPDPAGSSAVVTIAAGKGVKGIGVGAAGDATPSSLTFDAP